MKEFYRSLFYILIIMTLIRNFRIYSFQRPEHPSLKTIFYFFAGFLLLCLPVIFLADQPLQDICKSLGKGTFRQILFLFNQAGDGNYLFPVLSVLWFTAFVLRLKPETQKALFLSLASAMLAGIFAQIFKHIFWRARPGVFRIAVDFFNYPVLTPSKFGGSRFISFPSGHTSSVFGAFSAIYFMIRKKRLLWTPIFLIPVLTGLARISFNKHWTSDVLFGTGIGVLTGWWLVQSITEKTAIKDSSPDRV